MRRREREREGTARHENGVRSSVDAVATLRLFQSSAAISGGTRSNRLFRSGGHERFSSSSLPLLAARLSIAGGLARSRSAHKNTDEGKKVGGRGDQLCRPSV